jgi:hypothetical protein
MKNGFKSCRSRNIFAKATMWYKLIAKKKQKFQFRKILQPFSPFQNTREIE